MAVEIAPIRLPQDAKAWVSSWWAIYEGEPGWVPPLMMDRLKFLDPGQNPYFKLADVQCFAAKRDGKIVGTIAATVDHEYQKVEAAVGFFGFFEFIDDEEVARGLLDAAGAWLKGKGMKEMQGPFNFNSNHDFGCLIDGFDTPAMIANPHGRPYYGPMLDRIGAVKKMDWYAYWIDNDGSIPPSIKAISERFMKRNPQVTLRMADLSKFEQEVAIFEDIYNDAWEDNWGHVRLSREEFQALAKDFKQIIDPRLCWIAEVDGKPAALTLTLPDYKQVFKKMNGSLFPFGWYHFLFGRRSINQIRVFILGVKREFQKMPLGAPLYVRTFEEGIKMGVRGAEASLILETNFRMRGALEKMGGKIYKTYRIYSKEL
jgi:hypothetical protein